MRADVHARKPAPASVTVFAAALAITGCGDGATLPPSALRDPATCQACHPAQFVAWSRSMHAYASDDPVFAAMNRRGQRETNGTLGDFCVKCHAPQALRDGLTTDGTNLDSVPAASKGITCFFCHSTEAVEGTHDAALRLATDGRMFGPLSDPDSSAPHHSAYSALFDEGRTESAGACGACHDIVNGHGVELERTFAEWQGTLFAIPPHGLTCSTCHMNGSDGPAATTSSKTRRLHDHAFPAVDIGLSPFRDADVAVQTRDVQAALEGTLQGTICLDDVEQKILVAIDNVGAGHAWPSGAAQDRRAWVEVTATAGDQLVYRSGVALGGTATASLDPDVWVLRDCIYGPDGAEVQMFWDAALHLSNTLPGPVTPDLANPATLVRTHLKRTYPLTGALAATPDRITLDVMLKPIGDDVLGSLVASGDLDPTTATAMPTFRLGGSAPVVWTRAMSTSYVDGTGKRLACVSTGNYTPMATVAEGLSHARCPPQPASVSP